MRLNNHIGFSGIGFGQPELFPLHWWATKVGIPANVNIRPFPEVIEPIRECANRDCMRGPRLLIFHRTIATQEQVGRGAAMSAAGGAASCRGRLSA